MAPIVAIDARLLTRTNTGDTSYWRGLTDALIRAESDIRFLLYSDADRPDFIADSVEWIKLEAPNGRLWTFWSFPKDAIERGADVIHSEYIMSPLVGHRGVTTIHDVSFLIEPAWFGLKDRALLRTLIPWTVRTCCKVITVSNTSKEEIERLIPSAHGKVEVTYNALGQNIQPMARAEAERIVRGDLRIEGPYVFTVGTRWPRKNLALAVEAVALLGDAAPHKLVVTGKAGWGEEAQNERTIYTGYVDDRSLTALYQCASLYLAPAYHEGFGIPVLEAFACGCPVLSSSGGALPEVVGGAGVVEPSFDPKAWRERIAEMLNDSSRLDELRRAGHERLRDFDWNTTAGQTIEVYRAIIEGRCRVNR